MDDLGKFLLGIGFVLAISGVVILLLSRVGAHRFPGDVIIRTRGVTIYLPIGLMVFLSLLLTLLLNLLARK